MHVSAKAAVVSADDPTQRYDPAIYPVPLDGLFDRLDAVQGSKKQGVLGGLPAMRAQSSPVLHRPKIGRAGSSDVPASAGMT